MPALELTKEAEAKLKTLAECLNLENESTAVNELFYQFVLNQDPDKRRMIMSVYEMNAKALLQALQDNGSGRTCVKYAPLVLHL
jgi:hypothetical protein